MSTTPMDHKATTKIHSEIPRQQLLKTGLTAALVGIVAVEAYAALVKAAGIPMRAGFLAAAHAQPVTAVSFATGVFVGTFWGTVLAIVLLRLFGRPRKWFLLVSTALAALSLVVPIGAGATTTSTRLALAGSHIIVALVVIPILASRLP